MENIDRALEVLQFLKDNPDRHDQRTWRCGTTMCFAGWYVEMHPDVHWLLPDSNSDVDAVFDTIVVTDNVHDQTFEQLVCRYGFEPSDVAAAAGFDPDCADRVTYVSEFVKRDLGLSYSDADDLFYAHNLDELATMLDHLAAG